MAHDEIKDQYDEVQAEGLYAEGMARMALYHQHCQDPVIFRALGDVGGKSLLDLACGDGFYTRRFRRAGAHPVVGVDLSPQQIAGARRIEAREPLGIEYLAADVVSLELEQRFDLVTAIHLLHYLEGRSEIEAVLRKIHNALEVDGCFVTMIANPEFDLERHDPEDSRTKFAYYFSVAEPENGGLMRFHPGGFSREREITVEFHRWHRECLNDIAVESGFAPEWHEPFISEEGLEQYGAAFFENYLGNPQSKLLRFDESRRSEGLAARGETPPAFDGRCIPGGYVAARSTIPDILTRRNTTVAVAGKGDGAERGADSPSRHQPPARRRPLDHGVDANEPTAG